MSARHKVTQAVSFADAVATRRKAATQGQVHQSFQQHVLEHVSYYIKHIFRVIFAVKE